MAPGTAPWSEDRSPELIGAAGAVSAAVGLLSALWIMNGFLPGSWRDAVGRWIPCNAGGQIIATRPAEHMLSPWAGFAVFAGYAAIALVAGVVLARRRDA